MPGEGVAAGHGIAILLIFSVGWYSYYYSRKGGTGGGGWGHPQRAVHMAAARLGYKRTVVGSRWANSHPGCMSRLRKCYSHLVGGSFLAGKASWAPSGCLPTKSPD